MSRSTSSKTSTKTASGGDTRETLTVGRDAMAQIAAVEGISLSSDLERLLADLDRAGASSEERRRAVAFQFGKKR